MRTVARIVLISALLAGCTQQDANPDYNPRKDLPAWSYDAPYYYRPTEDLQPVDPEEAGFEVAPGIDVYFTNSEYFFLRHPSGYQVTGEPRMAVWYSTDHRDWQRAGYYGVEQSHFLMRAEKDAQYWVRFAGPGQPTSEVPPGQPHRIYVVDRAEPAITLRLDPPPFRVDEEGNRVPHTYEVGDEVSLAWTVNDPYLKPGSIQLSTCFAEFPHNLVWGRWPRELDAEGRIDNVVLPPAAARHGGMRFRLEARDLAGNIGLAMTDVMDVEPGESTATQPSVRPVGGFEIVYEQPARDDSGWPRKGAFLRAGRRRELSWMPELVQRHAGRKIDLEFSANNGRSWHVVAENIEPVDGGAEGRPEWSVSWTVPDVTSKNCRLRIVARSRPGEPGETLMLAQSGRFTVDTVPPDTILGPERVE